MREAALCPRKINYVPQRTDCDGIANLVGSIGVRKGRRRSAARHESDARAFFRKWLRTTEAAGSPWDETSEETFLVEMARL